MVITLPYLFVMINVRLVMTPVFLSFEYNRPGFPEDVYGLTREDRLMYAPYAVNYLLNGADITYLGDLTFPDGSLLFNVRELQHMRDVKILTQIAYWVTVGMALGVLAASVVLRRIARLRLTLFRGALLTIGVVIAIAAAAVFNWDFFFTGFHELFFQGNTWYFAYSDTLIRLFPEQFWFDAALTIGALTVLEAFIVIFITLRWRRTSF